MWRIKKLFIRQKNIKFFYYVRCALRELYPFWWFRQQLQRKLNAIPANESEYILMRVNYYNKLDANTTLSETALAIANHKLPKRNEVYYFDFIEYARYFNTTLRIHLLEGDITHVPEEPTILKSRPVAGDNRNSVLLNLNKVRHFNFVRYDRPYNTKKNMLVWRGEVQVEHRERFMKMYIKHPMCNVGKTNTSFGNPQWLRERLSIDQQLEYKFILCIEGNDVATNLKWVMSSNSIAVMPKPKFETWFMEATLIPDFHYVLIKDDYSDLEERLNFFIQHNDKALQIVENAHEYLRQFYNQRREDLISLMVLQKYFIQTGQLSGID